MNICHYYLSRGLWKVVECYYDSETQGPNGYFLGLAVQPNGNSFGSHIVATPWQQSWAALNLLEKSYNKLSEEKLKLLVLSENDLAVIKTEVDFQYVLRNYTADPVADQLFSSFSRLASGSQSEEVKVISTELKLLIRTIIEENKSEAHLLVQRLIQKSLFTSCFEQWLSELLDERPIHQALCGAVIQAFCSVNPELLAPHVISISHSSFRVNLFLLILASDEISLLRNIENEELRIYRTDLNTRWTYLLENGFEPRKLGEHMLLLGTHPIFQILEVVEQNIEDLLESPSAANMPTIIWPLFLLQHWGKVAMSDDLLLFLVDKCKSLIPDQTIVQMSFILEWYINFSKWYERNSENSILDVSGNLLEKAKEHSVLHLINKSTDLSSMQECQIRSLLWQRSGKQQSTDQPWDVVLYDGYCAMFEILRAIFSSCEIDKHARAQRTRLDTVTELNEYFEALYIQEVTKRLDTARELIKTLYPLNFRLEILENIFSLVFITFEDIKNVPSYLKHNVNIEEKLQPKKSKGDISLNRSDEGLEETGKPASKPRGFVCRKHIMRDIFFLVKDCLVVLEADPATHSSSKTQIGAMCSIKITQMENRLDRLSECMSEATWRLQLVTDPAFVSQVGSLQSACLVDSHHNMDVEWLCLPRDTTTNTKPRKKAAAERTNESGGSQSHSSPGNNGADTSTYPATKLRPAVQSVMSHMLSCDASLVVRCLSQGDVLNANHIIQMMCTEENRQTLEGELHFTESVNNLKKKLQNIAIESPSKRTSTDPISKSWSLQSIQMVANQGVSSTALTNHIERFLTVTTLPSIQGASMVSLGSMLQCIDNAHAIVTIDLALTTTMSHQDLKDLLNIASKHCPELISRAQSPITAQAFSKPMGYITFSQHAIALLQEVNKARTDESDAEVSLYQFLRSHQYPFALKSLKDNIGFWKQLKQAAVHFYKSAEESKSVRGTKDGLVAKCQKNIKEMQKVFESVTKLMEGCSEFIDLSKGEGGTVETTRGVNYSDLLCRYLTDLATLMLDNMSPRIDGEDEVVTFHSLLEESAVDIVDRLVFSYHVEPSALEKKAQQLGFNLSASLVAGCCPPLPQMIHSAPADDSQLLGSDLVVLNELPPDYKPVEELSPIVVVTALLSELRIAMANYLRSKEAENAAADPFLTAADMVELKNDFKVQGILDKTVELNFVQLGLLTPGEETLAFLTNLLSLMLVHCYLSSKLAPDDGVYSDTELYRELGFAFVGYKVSSLGFVSISDVRSQLFGEEVRWPFTKRKRNAWNDIHFHTDPRVLFTIPTFRSHSPRLCVLPPTGLDEFLQQNVQMYLQTAVLLNGTELNVSDTLEWLLEKVILNQEPESQSASDGGRSVDRVRLLLEFLLEHTVGELHDHLAGCLPSDVTLNVVRSSAKVVLALEYLAEGTLTPSTSPGTCAVRVEKWAERLLSEPIVKHLSQSSRVLADIIQKIHEAKAPPLVEVARDVLTEEKLRYLDLYLASPWVQQLAPLFDNNVVIAALSKYPDQQCFAELFNSWVHEATWDKCWQVLFALPDYHVFSHSHTRRLRDLVLVELTIHATQNGEERPWSFSQHINEVYIKMDCIMTNCSEWPGSVAVELLSGLLKDYPELPADQKDQLQQLLNKVQVYYRISESCPEMKGKTWIDVESCSVQNIMEALVRANQLELCLEWANLPSVLTSVEQYIDAKFMNLLLHHLPPQHAPLADRLLASLAPTSLTPLCSNVISQLRSTSSIRHMLRFLPDQRQRKMIAVGVELLEVMDVEDKSKSIHLVASPLLIIEQLLMNTALLALEEVLRKVRVLSPELLDQTEVNGLITKYISKAVEVKYVRIENPEPRRNFMLDTSIVANQEFAVPAQVPDKTQWVPDDQVSCCMCCLVVTFSMFNRRHHCRRCGRVVCATCSPHRLKVSGYKGVPVRVCQTCFTHHSHPEVDMGYHHPIPMQGKWREYTVMLCFQRGSMSTDTLDGSSLTADSQLWTLSMDETKNTTVRDEFCYENSPNVSLCLGLFNLLPDATFASLLLDEAEKLLSIVQDNVNADSPELNSAVLIQIIRSLVLGAKVRYAQANLTTGVVSCDGLLSQADLLQLLVKNHCAELIPKGKINGASQRQLRDRLVEQEVWGLALEVSTKCGLDKKGVWASWGKLCLSAGCWAEARVKFSHCLVETPKPSRNPPLVDEICRILENSSTFSLKQVPKSTEKEATAEEVTQILAGLKALSSGKGLPVLTPLSSSSSSAYYDEQLYYLTTYGSHSGLLTFFLKYDQWRKALDHVIREELEPELFVEFLLLPSYMNEKQERLKAEILSMDSTLNMFKKYLTHSCMQMQKSGYLHTLYDLQVMMQDCVRSAMTCIQLYQRGAKQFQDLVARARNLHGALRHLEEELIANNKKSKRAEHAMRMDSREVNRHISTVLRQLEVAKFLAGSEENGKPVVALLNKLREKLGTPDSYELPTLFDGGAERIVLAALIILTGRNVEEGFGVAFRVVQDYHLDSERVYLTTANLLAEQGRVLDVEQLINCIKTSGVSDVSTTCDAVLASSISLLESNVESKDMEPLLKLITNVDIKISALIDAKQLKSAYLLAVKHNRLTAVLRIKHVAEQLGQEVIKKICIKKLGQSPEGSICSSVPSHDSLPPD